MLVEHLACVAQASDMNPGVFEILIIPRQAMNRLPGFVLLALACNSPVQIEYVELCARVTQQMRDVPESSYALQTKCVPTIADGPIPALIAEDPFLGAEARPRVANVGELPRAFRVLPTTCSL